MLQYYVRKLILVRFNAARVRQASQTLGNILPLHISHSSMEREQGKKERKGEGILIPSSDPLLEERQLVTPATAGHIPALKGHAYSCDCRQGDQEHSSGA